MPLTPAITDKFTKVGSPGSATTLAAPGYTIGNANINVGATTNWQTETLQVFAIDRAQVVNGAEVRIANTYNEFVGIVTSATAIGNLTKRYGTAQDYAAGSLTRVYIPVSSTRENDMIDGLAQDHNLKGNHKTLTDDNGNEWLERGSVASAVNHVKITNAITGGAARVDAAGDDAVVDVYFGGKGGGVAHNENPELIGDYIASGGVIAQSAGLIGTFSNIVYYIAGKRYKKSTVANKTYTASKDTYVDIDTSGNITYIEVANGATVGFALTANSVRVAKVVTSGVAITSVTQDGKQDALGVINYQPAPIGSGQLAPGIINIKATSASNHTITTTAYADIVGISGTYKSGATPERLWLQASYLWQASTGSSYNMAIMVNGVLGEDEDYVDTVPVHWVKGHVEGFFDIPANTTVTIKLQGRGGAAGNGLVSFGSGGLAPTWKPSIRGFAFRKP